MKKRMILMKCPLNLRISLSIDPVMKGAYPWVRGVGVAGRIRH